MGPLRYMALLALFGSEPNKSLRDEATLALKNATALRAAYARRAALPPADKAALLPEYALPHVAMILAGTAQTTAEPINSPLNTARDIHFFVSNLLASHHDFSFAHRIAAAISHSRNVGDDDNNTFPQLCGELMILVIQRLSNSSKSWKISSAAAQELFLPSSFEVLHDAPRRVLPAGWQLPRTMVAAGKSFCRRQRKIFRQRKTRHKSVRLDVVVVEPMTMTTMMMMMMMMSRKKCTVHWKTTTMVMMMIVLTKTTMLTTKFVALLAVLRQRRKRRQKGRRTKRICRRKGRASRRAHVPQQNRKM